jgi:hypothetical protein
LIVEVFGDPALTELVRPDLGVQAHDLFAVACGGEIEGQEVPRLGRTVDIGERPVGFELLGLCCVDLFLGRAR